jgi:microcystin-dependent protein
MALENLTGTGKYISDLVVVNPSGIDPKSQGDDHIRGIKNVLKNTFPNVDGAVETTDEELTFSTGLTGNIQDQLDAIEQGAKDYTDDEVAKVVLGFVGMIAPFPISTPPSGWIECDGSAIDPQYSALVGLVGANTPDLRGVFVRGWDNGKGTDSGRAINTDQDDSFQDHWHDVEEGNVIGGTKRRNVGGALAGVNVVDTGGSSLWKFDLNATDIVENVRGSAGVPKVSDETRPKNVALMYCIKHD